MDLAEEGSALLEHLRPNAFALAYRMLGSVSDAEDIVQEALLRLHKAMAGDDAIASPQAYLATVVTRLCIDELRSARHRRESYIGEWLPEPVIDARPDVTDRLELSDSLSMAFMILLESLSPEQRAVLLLRDVFDYDYPDIARITGKSESACRQLAVRARASALARRPRFEVDPQQRNALADGFFAAVEAGDFTRLEDLLSTDVSLHGDGGGKVPALARPVVGRTRVIQALRAWANAGQRAGGYRVRRSIVNGQPGALIMTSNDTVFGVWALDVADGKITAIRSVVNPDKLRHIEGSGNFLDWLKGNLV